jgi:SAM-dependent methyltransferase
LRVSNAEELVKIQRSLEEAGFPTEREDNVECCYARQTKFRINNPDLRLWEVYVFNEDVAERGAALVPDAKQNDVFARHMPQHTTRWEYRIPEPLPPSVPHADDSLDEAQVEGAFNLKRELGVFARLVSEAFRALRPGGLLRMHGLAGDQRLDAELPALPGPAAVVEMVPSITEPMQIMLSADFIGRFEKLSQAAYFTIAGVPTHEVILTGRPGYRPKKLAHSAVYLGPLSQVTDDFGNVFRRGERVSLNIH